MQINNIYNEGDEVFAENESGDKYKLYVEKLLSNGGYKMRSSETKGEGLVKKEFAETELTEKEEG